MKFTLFDRIFYSFYPIYNRLAPKSKKHKRRLSNSLIDFTKRKVINGPFKGMQYVESSIGSVYLPKLLGIYENELHDVLNVLIKEKFSTVINIGAAEGYYSVGFTLQNEHSNNFSFETDPKGQKLQHDLAKLNNVESRLHVYGNCGIEELKKVINKNQTILIIMDIEGYESILLDPQKINDLKFCTILLEMHDEEVDGLEKILKKRFNDSHNYREIWNKPRTISDFPEAIREELETRIPDRLVKAVLRERSYVKQRWWVLTPKSKL